MGKFRCSGLARGWLVVGLASLTVAGGVVVHTAGRSTIGRWALVRHDPVEEILWWLPEDTETVIAARGPFRIPKWWGGSLLAELRQTLVPFLEKPMRDDPLAGHTVLLAVRGSRKFHGPRELGGMLYEGCDILLLRQDPTEGLASPLAIVERFGADERAIQGHRVLHYSRGLNQDTWHFFATMPRAGVLLHSTDEQYLRAVLERMHRRAARRALPERLPEWGYVDTSAPFWAVRHYDRSNAAFDMTSPYFSTKYIRMEDPSAIGMTVTYDLAHPSTVTMSYLSRDSVAAARYVGYRGREGVTLRGRWKEPGVVEMEGSIRGNSDVAPYLWLYVMQELGHGIHV